MDYSICSPKSPAFSKDIRIPKLLTKITEDYRDQVRNTKPAVETLK